MNNFLQKLIRFYYEPDGAEGGEPAGETKEEVKEDVDASGEKEKLGWRTTLRPEQRDTELAKKFSKVPELFDYVTDLEGKVKNAVMKPDSEDKEALDKFYRDLGRPDNPEGYELPVKDDLSDRDREAMEKVKGWFAEAAHQSGLTKEQARAMFQGYTDIVEQEIAEYNRSYEAQKEEVQKEILKEYGDEAEGLIKGMNNFVLKYAGEDFYSKLTTPDEKGKTLGNDPVVAKGMVDLYKLVRDDKVQSRGQLAADKNRGYVYTDMEE